MRFVFFLLCLVGISHNLSAQNIQKMSEAEQLGMTAGLAAACGAQKLSDFELIASRLIANAAPTEKAEKQQIRAYMQMRYNTIQRQKKDAPIPCSEILEHFNQIPLFNAIVYRDGSVKLPDGVWSKPIRPLNP